jgi:exosome complex RNA-binding protein Csl4
MRRLASVKTGMALAVAAVLLVPAAYAQERGEEVIGKITRVDRGTVVVHSDAGNDVRIRVTPSTEVFFQDSGDRKLFPNPTSADLREGMGVKFTYGTGTPDRVVVVFVPGGGRPIRPMEPEAAATGSEVLKARIESIRRDGRELTADVAGRSQSFRLQTRDTRMFKEGDMVVLHVENRGGERVVTRIDSADQGGRVTRVDRRRRTISIETNGREETYTVDRSNVLDNVREGDRIRFEVEERGGGGRVITQIFR